MVYGLTQGLGLKNVFLRQEQFRRADDETFCLRVVRDLMEGFRPLIVDSAVITAVNTRMVTPEDFIQVGPSVALTPKGRKRFITAYEQRMDALVTHPLFGYRVNYRRVLEIQARLLARVVCTIAP